MTELKLTFLDIHTCDMYKGDTVLIYKIADLYPQLNLSFPTEEYFGTLSNDLKEYTKNIGFNFFTDVSIKKNKTSLTVYGNCKVFTCRMVLFEKKIDTTIFEKVELF
jgi:hypothetical protein